MRRFRQEVERTEIAFFPLKGHRSYTWRVFLTCGHMVYRRWARKAPRTIYCERCLERWHKQQAKEWKSLQEGI
jgi:hypothetical protein